MQGRSDITIFPGQAQAQFRVSFNLEHVFFSEFLKVIGFRDFFFFGGGGGMLSLFAAQMRGGILQYISKTQWAGRGPGQYKCFGYPCFKSPSGNSM